MTSKELASAGVPLLEENAPSRTNDLAAETIHNSGSCEDGEIWSENKSSGDEYLSNVEVDMNELLATKVKSYPPAFVFGKSKIMTEIIKEYERARFFPIGDGLPPF
jgi:hypothetical protein